MGEGTYEERAGVAGEVVMGNGKEPRRSICMCNPNPDPVKEIKAIVGRILHWLLRGRI